LNTKATNSHFYSESVEEFPVKYLFFAWKVEQQIGLNQSLGSYVEECDIFIGKARKVACFYL